mmetsp:Transcript_35241/g.93373  ORF Transcript_35241/g.93373 Transcript_35241/m.93373 type:complete len:338 (+) Transcript_35241:105-1118(+)
MPCVVGVVGATGAVGEEMVKVLFDRKFPLDGKPRLFASERSAGKKLATPYGEMEIELFSVEAVQECDFALLAVSGDFSTEFSPQIVANGKTCVIDNSSAFRYKDDVPLVVPEINPEAMKGKLLIANPNCTTAIAAMALWPIHQKYVLKKAIVSTYQAASGAGVEGMNELQEGMRKHLDGEKVVSKVFAHPLPFNVIPHIDSFQENGYTKEEMKVAWELRKIFGMGDDVKVSCTCVRVPTLRAHSESIVIETEEKIDPKDVMELLRTAPGVKLVDDVDNFMYPMPLNATGCDDVEVGRIRQSLIFGEYGIEFFCSGDQLLRGAALNAVIIAEMAVAAR